MTRPLARRGHGAVALMARATFMLLVCLAAALPAAAQSDRPLGQALTAMQRGDWDGARALSARDGPVARDIIEWHRLREGFGSHDEVTGFLDRRPDWPGEAWLLKQSEPAFGDAPRSAVLAHFAEHPPQTAEGHLIHADALTDAGRTGEADASLVLAWRTLPMGRSVQELFLRDHRALLAPHHADRLDQMIWNNDYDSADRMLPLVADGPRKLAQARLALLRTEPGVDSRIAAVPDALADDPGLAHARFVWRDRKGRDDAAIDLLLAQSTSPDTLGQPAAWGPRRRVLARQEMRDGNPNRAYEIAARHYMVPDDGYAYADLEWLAGYIALRKLDDPATALRHFQRFDAAVLSPISKGRGAYWMGRAHEALGDERAAKLAYADGADYQTSFYGLLSAEKVGLPFDDRLIGPTAPANWRDAPFTRKSNFEAGLLLISAGDPNLAERFITHLAESLDATEAAQLGEAALSMDRPHLAVMIGKRVATRGIVIPRAYYAVHPVGLRNYPMAPEMTLAIARRESEFDPRVISGAGARGLMQVMPGTGEDVARDLGILSGHSRARMIDDWRYNARLGTFYLAELAESFDGNVVLMAAGYNAGPRRPIRWMDERGDPRHSRVDMIDWIEHIPFRETRNYVMRVTESLPVYRARLGQPAHPLPFSQELTGSTLRAFAP
ncbi:MAG: lytic transglycosylase domain-containing protein [Marinibacterium sp.]|nr:lytic transglycosylase domain-containing protein [Marinibacterium sp.]